MESIKQEKVGVTPTRKCIDCGCKSGNLELFVTSKESKYGRRNLCWSCMIIRNEKHPKTKDWKTDHQTKKRYGIDAETYKRFMNTSSCCQICGSTRELCYDHCHSTMKFRGVLCRQCNRSIGQLGDSSVGLQKALDYLLKAENE
jgi:hypothetical protein